MADSRRSNTCIHPRDTVLGLTRRDHTLLNICVHVLVCCNRREVLVMTSSKFNASSGLEFAEVTMLDIPRLRRS